jgi:hypothetical protein
LAAVYIDRNACRVINVVGESAEHAFRATEETNAERLAALDLFTNQVH